MILFKEMLFFHYKSDFVSVQPQPLISFVQTVINGWAFLISYTIHHISYKIVTIHLSL